jgi:hypothetical protein
MSCRSLPSIPGLRILPATLWMAVWYYNAPESVVGRVSSLGTSSDYLRARHHVYKGARGPGRANRLAEEHALSPFAHFLIPPSAIIQ